MGFGKGGWANCGGPLGLWSWIQFKVPYEAFKGFGSCDLTQIALKIPVACIVENRL